MWEQPQAFLTTRIINEQHENSHVLPGKDLSPQGMAYHVYFCNIGKLQCLNTFLLIDFIRSVNEFHLPVHCIIDAGEIIVML